MMEKGATFSKANPPGLMKCHAFDRLRVLLVDDQPLLRLGITRLIDHENDLIVCGEADSINSTRTAVGELAPDLMIFDLNLGGGDMIELIKDFKVRYPMMVLLVFSQCTETGLVTRALRAGAAGYALKQESAEGLLNAIRTVLDGRMYVSRKIAAIVLRNSLDDRSNPEDGRLVKDFRLTDRELHVFRLVGLGLGTRQIAGELQLSVKTIEAHREHIKQKLDLKGSGELKRCATDWVRERFAPG